MNGVQEPNHTISLGLPVLPCSMVERYHCVVSKEPAACIFKTIPEVDAALASKTVVPICHTACVTYQKNINPSFTVVTSLLCFFFVSEHKEFVINTECYIMKCIWTINVGINCVMHRKSELFSDNNIWQLLVAISFWLVYRINIAHSADHPHVPHHSGGQKWQVE